MTKYVVGSKILKKEQVLISIFLIAILLLSSGSMVAFASSSNASGRTITVLPNGHDDTSDIQAAFIACGSIPRCTVQLEKGTYYITSQIVAYGFQGSFVGAGEGLTTVEVPSTVSLPSEASEYNTPSATAPYWATTPTPAYTPKGAPWPDANPWPNIFTFVGGSFSISGMTIEDLNPVPVTSYWYFGSESVVGWLFAAIQIIGQPSPASLIPQVSTTINQVNVVGSPATCAEEPDTCVYTPTGIAWNMLNAIVYGGQLLPSVPPSGGWTPANVYRDIIPVSGTFSVTNSAFNTVDSGPGAEFTDSATATVCYNTLQDSPIPLWAQDISNTKVTFCGNQGTDIPVAAGIVVQQAVSKPACTDAITSDCLLPSTVYATDNSFQQANWGGSGVYMADIGTPSTLSGVVTGNTVVTDTSCQATTPTCYTPGYPVIGVADLSSALVSQNTILSGGSGVWVLAAKEAESVVSDNHITGAMVGVLLGCYPELSDCVAPTPTANGVHVTGNVIKNSAQYGIAVISDSSYNKIIGNFITGTAKPPAGYDLYWDQTGTGNVWLGNICQTSSPPGLC